jgi:hypothetical protein
MVQSRVDQAIENNVRWCEAVCRSHGAPGRVEASHWWTQRQVPRFYSNLITRVGGAGQATQRAALRTLIEAGRPESFSVKDSFGCLDLSDLGFEKLFEARWIWRAAESAMPPGGEGIRWEVVESEAELGEWEAAFTDHDANQTGESEPRLFLPALLEDPDIAFLAGRATGPIVAVAVANRSGDVVGLSNLFARKVCEEPVWPSCVRQVQELFPGRPIVGYEQGADLESALALGFELIGPLAVWLRPG